MEARKTNISTCFCQGTNFYTPIVTGSGFISSPPELEGSNNKPVYLLLGSHFGCNAREEFKILEHITDFVLMHLARVFYDRNTNL
jgi:hypothetical protein